MWILYKAYMPDPQLGEKSHGNSADLMVFQRGMPISLFFKKINVFLISSTYSSFWDVTAENKPILWEGMIWVDWHVSKIIPSFC